MNIAYWINTAWMWDCEREARRFRQASRSVARTQADTLQEIVARNKHSRFGAEHGFSCVQNPEAFQRHVPLTTYDTIAVSIEQIAAGRPNVLTADPVRLLEPTSGSTGGEKLIPYTRLLRKQFQRGIAVWIADLMRRRPAVRRGRAYWSISPSLGGPRSTSGGIPIGFEDDTAYLGWAARRAQCRLLAVPSSVSRLTDMENFRYCTLLFLLGAADLALISVWNPTFLTALLRPLESWMAGILQDLRHGTLTLPNPHASDTPTDLLRHLKRDIRRADELERIFGATQAYAERLRQTWPKLALISCWTDAAAARYVSTVRDLLPEVEIQPKGLLATEGIVSIPLLDRVGAALAIRSHFFEFEDVDMPWDHNAAAVRLRLAHELQEGQCYRVVVTTGGGLYRYRLGDLVEVVGFENECPLLRFLGRPDQVSDLVGEKLAEPHVRKVLDNAFAAANLTAQFAMLVPVDARIPHYRLLVQHCNRPTGTALLASLAASVQVGLEQNPYYRHAVCLGQLAPVDVRVLDEASPPAWSQYEQSCVARGQKPGDVKPTVLGSWSAGTQGDNRGS